MDGYDEISLTSDFKVAMPEKEKVYSPEMIGMKRYREEDLYGGDTPAAASAIFDRVLNNTSTEAQRDCVLANSAFAIQVICPEKSIADCLSEARESLQSGRALSVLKKFIEVNG
jgi:anthranilate phosphoribosyltransferase